MVPDEILASSNKDELEDCAGALAFVDAAAS
jgi:hypothetical protein